MANAAAARRRDFIGGAAPGHGDLGLYANLWFLVAMPFAKVFADTVFARPKLVAWFQRMSAFGHGDVIESNAEEAIAIASVATPATISGPVEAGLSVGQAVQIKTETSGDAPVAGQLLRCCSEGITIRRESERAGPVNVHFPRIGQIVIAG